jgi:hypothetical protein
MKLTRKVSSSFLIVIGLRLGVALSLLASGAAEAWQDYGSPYPLTMSEANVLNYLQWPQNRRSIIDRLGYPNAYDGDFDYYDLESGGYVAVRYEGRRAVGFVRGF